MNPTPRIWNVPHNRNPLFIGRADELEQLRQTFGVGGLASQKERGQILGGPLGVTAGRGDVVALTQTIAGLGGIGKTSLVTEYCYKYQNEYAVVWWIRSQESATLASDYAALAVKLDARFATEPNLPALIDYVREWLRVNERWLLIFDNANAPEEIRAYLPPVGSGHILITSREAVWDEIGKTVPLPTLPREEAIRFLLANSNDSNRDAANALAHELGDFPLALEHARAYVKQTGNSLARYLELYRTRRTELLRETKTPLNYHSTIATTWDISIQQAAAQSPASADLLNLCAFFAPDDIPLEVIREGAEFLPSDSYLASHVKRETSSVELDEMVLDNAIAALRHYSLIERKESNLSVHRLVQAVTREKMDEHARKQWAEAAVRIVDDAITKNRVKGMEFWNISPNLFTHALVVCQHADMLNIKTEDLVHLLHEFGRYAFESARFEEARTTLKRALELGLSMYAEDDSRIASIATIYGLVLQELNDLENAKLHFENALRIHLKNFGPRHALVAIAFNNMGGFYHWSKDFRSALEYYKQAYEIDCALFVSIHPNIARGLNNIGGAFYDLRNFAEAKKHFEQALEIDEQIFGKDHPEVARDLNNMGLVLMNLGEFEKARSAYQRALRILERSFGENHPKTITTLRNLQDLDAQTTLSDSVREC